MCRPFWRFPSPFQRQRLFWGDRLALYGAVRPDPHIFLKRAGARRPPRCVPFR